MISGGNIKNLNDCTSLASKQYNGETDEIHTEPFAKFIKDLKDKFEKRFAGFKKIKNVVQLLNQCFSLKPKATGEAVKVFKSNKAAYKWLWLRFKRITA